MIKMTKSEYNVHEIDSLVEEVFGPEAWYDADPIEEDSDGWDEILGVYSNHPEWEDEQVGTLFIKGEEVYVHYWFGVWSTEEDTFV